MSAAPDHLAEAEANDGVVFVPIRGIEAAFLGLHLVGAVRPQPPAWRSFLAGEPHTPWRAERDVEAAKAALRRLARDWYNALHTRLEPGQAERLSRVWIS